jgi:hypothetical protein
MDGDLATSDRRGAGQGRARWALGIFLASIVLCVAVALSRDPNPPFIPPKGATSDLDVFRRIVHRVHAGDGFYVATQDELRTHGYPTRSVFNWRTPVYAWMLGGGLGMIWGPWVLIGCAIATIVMASRDALDASGIVPAAVSCVFLVGSTAWCFGADTYLFMELWAGMMIALSVCAYRRGLTAVGFAAGLFALFYRELALPYCVVALGLAVWKGRKREAAAWIAGLGLFAAFMAWHAYQVHSRLTIADLPMDGGWVKFGGIRFLLTTTQTNVFLMPLPLWCTAIYGPLVVIGLCGARDEASLRVALTAGLFLAAFSVVGNPFNFYWGFVNAPLLAMGLAGAPRVIGTLFVAAFPNAQAPPVAPSRRSRRGPERHVCEEPAPTRPRKTKKAKGALADSGVSPCCDRGPW